MMTADDDDYDAKDDDDDYEDMPVLAYQPSSQLQSQH
jgi:hypothetical protein